MSEFREWAEAEVARARETLGIPSLRLLAARISGSDALLLLELGGHRFRLTVPVKRRRRRGRPPRRRTFEEEVIGSIGDQVALDLEENLFEEL